MVPTISVDSLLSELATATYRAAKRQGFKDAFIDIELDLWYAHQALLNKPVNSVEPLAGSPPPIR